ncbi:hypothetical protein I3842_03G185800 [Carya illinoinensis]|uniref:Uncharacterized protein n=1 Tax=Carya illinoinensis TaxID=32201 RepID=A0A922FLG1_CARIL|nr:hypothetical protein I3842_03G185800 [Carya illinoinensis]
MHTKLREGMVSANWLREFLFLNSMGELELEGQMGELNLEGKMGNERILCLTFKKWKKVKSYTDRWSIHLKREGGTGQTNGTNSIIRKKKKKEKNHYLHKDCIDLLNSTLSLSLSLSHIYVSFTVPFLPLKFAVTDNTILSQHQPTSATPLTVLLSFVVSLLRFKATTDSTPVSCQPPSATPLHG